MLRCLFFDVRTGHLELVLLIAGKHAAFKGRHSTDPIRMFKSLARTGLCPDYDRLKNTVTLGTAAAVDW